MNIIVIDKKMPCPRVNRQNINIAEPRQFYVEAYEENNKIYFSREWTAVDNAAYSFFDDNPYFYEADEQFNQVIHPMYWSEFSDEAIQANHELFCLESFKIEYSEWYDDFVEDNYDLI